MSNTNKIRFLMANIDASQICGKLKSYLAEIVSLPRNHPNTLNDLISITINCDSTINKCDLIETPNMSNIETINTDIKNSKKIKNNCNETVDFIRTGISSIDEICDLLDYCENLCIEASNETKTATDKIQIGEEYLSLVYESQLIAKNTNFNSISIFNNVTDRESLVGEFTFRVRDSEESYTLVWQANVSWRLGVSADTINKPFGNDTIITGNDINRGNSRYNTLYRYLMRPDYIADQRYLTGGSKSGNANFDLDSINSLLTTNLTASQYKVEGDNKTDSDWNRGNNQNTDLGSSCLSTISNANAEKDKTKIVKQTVLNIKSRSLSVVNRVNSILDKLENEIKIKKESINVNVSNIINTLVEQLTDAIEYYELKARIYDKFTEL